MAKTKILIVDDDAENLTLLKGILRPAGYEVLDALCAEEALDIVSSRAVDLVISDAEDSGMSAADFLVELHGSDVHAPVIFISGSESDGAWLKAVRSSAAAFIEKPFEAETILSAVRDVFAARSNGRDGAKAQPKARLKSAKR